MKLLLNEYNVKSIILNNSCWYQTTDPMNLDMYNK